MILQGDAAEILKDINDNSIDLLVTDPPYGLVSEEYREGKNHRGGFMGKDWDKALVPMETWKECYRILKSGKLAFVMCSPRQDVLSRMIVNLQDAGFRTNYTSIYHTFASGFPKALNMEKALRKRYAQASESQMSQLWKAVIRSSEHLLEGNNRKPLQSMLASLEQGTQHQVYAFSGVHSQEGVIPERQQQSGLERWSMLQKEKGELSKCKVCKMPVGVYLNGKERRLCYGTQADNGSVAWESIDENGMCTSYQSSDIGQSFRELDVICEQCITQKIRESGVSGSYSGVQVKPAVEVILVVSKGKTITWLDDCRIPYQNDKDVYYGHHNTDDHEALGDGSMFKMGGINRGLEEQNEKGRFPANLLVEDDVLNDGRNYKTGDINPYQWSDNNVYDHGVAKKGNTCTSNHKGDEGSYSRYFSLDQWADKTLPFLICPKASKAERNKGCEDLPLHKGGPGFRQYLGETKLVRKNEPNNEQISEYIKYWRLKKGLTKTELGEYFKTNPERINHGGCVSNWETGDNTPTLEEWLKLKEILKFDDKYDKQMTEFIEVDRDAIPPSGPRQNHHPTVKPLKLMSYLITMGSREGDLILDPFCGSGTVCIAADQLHRKWIGIERNPEYAEIIKRRLIVPLSQLKLTVFD